jgi:glutathione S-transferase
MARPVKLYNHSLAPNPRRVRIFAAEKGIELALEEIDILAGQSRMPEFFAQNSSGAVPVLELDDGSYLSESVAICRYLEGLQPEPNLLGRDLREQAEVERWNRRMELELFAPIGRTFQNTNPIFQRRIKQFPEYGGPSEQSFINVWSEWIMNWTDMSSLQATALLSPTSRPWSRSISASV